MNLHLRRDFGPNITSDAEGIRVILLGPFPPPHGGVEVNLAALREFLRRHNVPCDVINLTRHRKTEGDGIFYPKSAVQVLNLMIRSKATMLHLHIGGDVTWRLLALGALGSMLPGKKMVLTLHSGGYPSSAHGNKTTAGGFRAFLFRRFDGVIAVNEQISQMFMRLGLPASRIRVISPFAISMDSVAPRLPDRLAQFVANHDPVILSVNGLEPEYDLRLQVDALEAFRRTHGKTGLIVVGTGREEDEFRSYCEKSGCSNAILLTGDLDRAIVLRLMLLATVLLRTTHYDGDSISVREALQFGLPVIATDNGMRPAGCRLIPVGDKAALLHALSRVITEGAAKRPASRPAHDEQNLVQVLEFYRDVIRDADSGSKMLDAGHNIAPASG